MSKPSAFAVVNLGSRHVDDIVEILLERGATPIIFSLSQVQTVLHSPFLRGIILAGGPESIDSRTVELNAMINSGVPVLAINSAMLLLAQEAGATIGKPGDSPRPSVQLIHVDQADPLFKGIGWRQTVWCNHHEIATFVPRELHATGHHHNLHHLVAFNNLQKQWWGVLFHPEDSRTVCGKQIIANFVHEICGCPLEEEHHSRLFGEPHG